MQEKTDGDDDARNLAPFVNFRNVAEANEKDYYDRWWKKPVSSNFPKV